MQIKPYLRKTAEFGILIAAITTLILAGCGGGESGSGGGGSTRLQISPSLGLFRSGAAVRIKDKNGVAIGSGYVNASGVASIDVPTGSQAPLLVEVGLDGDEYYDEKQDLFVKISGAVGAAIRALIPDHTITSQVAVTGFTEIAVGTLANASGVLPTSIATASAVGANTAVEQAFGISDLLLQPTLVGSSGVMATLSTTPSDIYAAKLAGLALMAGANEDALAVVRRLRDAMTGIAPASSVNDVVTAFNTAVNMPGVIPSLIKPSASIPAPATLYKLPDMVTAASETAQLTQLSQPSTNPGNDTTTQHLQSVTIKGLNKHLQGDSLVLRNNVGDTLTFTADGTQNFATPMTSAARWVSVVSQPAGKQVCAAKSHFMDVIDPYTQQLTSPSTSDYYCFESPCGSLDSLGQVPAPQGFTVTQNPDSTVSFNWQHDAWATGYRIYYSTDPNVVINAPATGISIDPATGQLAMGTEVHGINSPWSPPQGNSYYYAITATYLSPANLDSCQSAASAGVMAMVTPTVSSLSPTTGSAGTYVTISGSGFNATAANNTVKFNGISATVTAATATSLTVIVPNSASTGSVSITTAGGTATSALSFTVASPAPLGSIVMACDMPAAFTCQEYYAGTNSNCGGGTLPGVQAVASCPSANSASTLIGTCTVSTYLKNYYYVGTPLSAAQQSCALSSGIWTDTGAVGLPTITGISPGTGTVGATVIISGTNFDATPANNTVSFGGTWATVTAATAASLTVTVPPLVTMGAVPVSVSTTLGGNAPSTVNFTVVSAFSAAYQAAYDACSIGTPYFYATPGYCPAYATAIEAGSSYAAANQAAAVAAGSNVGLIGSGVMSVNVSGTTPNFSLNMLQYDPGIMTYSGSSTLTAPVTIYYGTSSLIIPAGTVQSYASASWTSPGSSGNDWVNILYHYGYTGPGEEQLELTVYAGNAILMSSSSAVAASLSSCSISGPNVIGLPTCSSWGISINRTAGTIVLTSTPVYDINSTAGGGTVSGSLRFVPF